VAQEAVVVFLLERGGRLMLFPQHPRSTPPPCSSYEHKRDADTTAQHRSREQQPASARPAKRDDHGGIVRVPGGAAEVIKERR